jgi:hypothetical protein
MSDLLLKVQWALFQLVFAFYGLVVLIVGVYWSMQAKSIVPILVAVILSQVMLGLSRVAEKEYTSLKGGQDGG